jgi:hypothetical protein
MKMARSLTTRHVRPFVSHDWAFDCHVIDLAVVLSFLSFVSEIHVGASSDFMDCSKGWEVGALLRGLLVLWRGGSGLGSNFG